MKTSFSGEIPELPGIGVDNFEDKTKRAYFLSHCHADHMVGLKELSIDLFRDKMPVYIYMTDISAAIVELDINADLKQYIKPLTSKTTIKLPADDRNGLEEMFVEVTPIPAGHSFGSVMFLFNTPQKKILYTGDFRITENSVSKMGQLHDTNQKPIMLDILYVDTTFQGREYETFPKRSETIDYIVREIKHWLSLDEENKVALVPSARYGYEFVFNKIFERMQMKVFVNNNWQLYSQFLDKLPGVTNDESSTKIHLCSKYTKYCSTCDTLADKKDKFSLRIRLSAMKWGYYNPEEKSVVSDKNSNRSLSVCFATHCSRSELVHFVEYLSPAKVVGFSEPYYGVDEPCAVTPQKRKTLCKVVNGSDERPRKVPKHVLKKMFG